MPETLLQLGSTGAVIYLMVFTLPKFLDSLKTMGERWDKERDQARKEFEAERKQFWDMLARKELDWAAERASSQEALMATIALAHKMVDNCQAAVAASDRVSADDVCAVGRPKRSRA